MKSEKMEELLDKLLIEDNSLQKIKFPDINKLKKGVPKNEKQTFKGRIIKNICQKGIYKWPDGQEFYGDLSPNNKFNGKGKMKFSDGNELSGTFDGNKKTITKAIYKAATRIYQGSFKNNKLDGNFIIKNKDNCEHYLYIGGYLKGFKYGKFTLEKIYNNQKMKVTGNFDDVGRKIGDFIIYNLEEGKEIFRKNYDYKPPIKIIEKEIEKKIEQKIEKLSYLNFFEYKEKKKIYSIAIVKESKECYILLGSDEYLLIYNINFEQNKIIYIKEIFLFKKGTINDILLLKDESKLLLCSSSNNIKFIELCFKEKSIDFKLIQELRGESNSNNIYSLIELSNGIVISGDCQNIITWEKHYLIDKIENDINRINSETNKSGQKGSKKNFCLPKINKTFQHPNYKVRAFINENIMNNQNYEYKKKGKKTFDHTFCMFEIKNENNKVILAVAQPDSKTICFIEIYKQFNLINIIKIIPKVNTVKSRKNIMTIFDNKLFIGCIDKIIVINIYNYEILFDIYSNEMITYITSCLDKCLILGLQKNINAYNNVGYLGYLEQKKLSNDNKSIISISKFDKKKFDGNIINGCIYNNNNKDYIAAIWSDGKILNLNILLK